jgi:multisubunit Na+/H+ antiporter MnhB subunit
MKVRSFILDKISKYIFVFINILAIYIFLKGHNQPGGGFIAGVASAISLVILVMVYGVKETKALLKFDPIIMAACGLLIAYLTSLAPIFFNLPFLYHKMVHLHLPILGELHIGTPFLFDLGVYLVVVGVTSKMIMCLEEAN